MRSYKDLKVWQRSVELVTDVYRLTKGFPKDEIYGLTSQIRRASVSVPSNIAEGSARSSKSFLSFLRISRGSLMEVETQLEIARRLEYISIEQKDKVAEEMEQIGKMLNGLMRKIEENVR